MKAETFLYNKRLIDYDIVDLLEEFAKISVDQYKKMRALGKEIECACLECKQSFVAPRKVNYCSNKCYQRSYKRKNRLKVAEWQADYRRRKKAELFSMIRH